jgi:hypothetical protein
VLTILTGDMGLVSMIRAEPPRCLIYEQNTCAAQGKWLTIQITSINSHVVDLSQSKQAHSLENNNKPNKINMEKSVEKTCALTSLEAAKFYSLRHARI